MKIIRQNKVLSFIRDNPFSSLLIAALAVAILKLYGLYTSVDTDDGRWQQFKIEHHCVLQPSKKASERLSWTCDDGHTYYSWRQQR